MLEQIVRPFQRPETVATRRIVATAEKVEVGTAIISWGAAGTLPGAEQIEAAEEVVTAFEVIDCDDEWDEVTRESEIVRITQTDENGDEVAENYVDVARPKSILFEKSTERPPYDKNSEWNTFLISSPIYSPFDEEDKKCKSNFNLKITIPEA